jgi:hypothetical protein
MAAELIDSAIDAPCHRTPPTPSAWASMTHGSFGVIEFADAVGNMTSRRPFAPNNE